MASHYQKGADLIYGQTRVELAAVHGEPGESLIKALRHEALSKDFKTIQDLFNKEQRRRIRALRLSNKILNCLLSVKNLEGPIDLDHLVSENDPVREASEFKASHNEKLRLVAEMNHEEEQKAAEQEPNSLGQLLGELSSNYEYILARESWEESGELHKEMPTLPENEEIRRINEGDAIVNQRYKILQGLPELETDMGENLDTISALNSLMDVTSLKNLSLLEQITNHGLSCFDKSIPFNNITVLLDEIDRNVKQYLRECDQRIRFHEQLAPVRITKNDSSDEVYALQFEKFARAMRREPGARTLGPTRVTNSWSASSQDPDDAFFTYEQFKNEDERDNVILTKYEQQQDKKKLTKQKIKAIQEAIEKQRLWANDHKALDDHACYFQHMRRHLYPLFHPI